jgi:hypothetical protein
MTKSSRKHLVNPTVSTLPLFVLAACGGGGGGGYGGGEYGQRDTQTNTAPTASNATISVEENTTHTFTASDFNFYDADSDALASVIVSMLDDTDDGTLTLDNAAITSRTTVTRSQLDDGDLQFTPDTDETGNAYNSFTFSVNDGTDDSAQMYMLTINVGAAPNPTSYTVSVSPASSGGGNAYYFGGEEKKSFQLQEGQTYVFDWSNATNHPLLFSITDDGAHGGGEAYTDGVVVDMAAGTTTITVAANAPDLFYYCERHAGMGGAATTPAASGGGGVGSYALGADIDAADSDAADSDAPSFYDMLPLAVAPAPASDIA